MKYLLVFLVMLAAAPAAAEVWTWTDASGEAHYTDDPSSIPQADRKNAHPMGEGGTVNVVHEDRDAPADDDAQPPSTDAGRLQAQKEQLEGEVGELKHQLANAERELRKYTAGGRAGAADAAEKARALVEDMKKQLARHERDLAVVMDQLRQLQPPAEP